MHNLETSVVHKLFMAALRASITAGEAIMEIYYSDHDEITVKSDYSIISLADQIAHKVIEAQLSITRVPLISEEGRTVNYEERKSWDLFWLIDPLDGTRQFTQKKKEFTVNIALLMDSRPVTGIIYAPALNEVYFAIKNYGAYRLELNDSIQHLDSFAKLVAQSAKLPLASPRQSNKQVILTSPHHVNIETKKYIEKRKKNCVGLEIKNIGSSLKMCLLASGLADAYPRYTATYEWDTAAAQVILEEAGGSILSFETGEPLIYNKESLLNPFFICTATKNHKIFM